MGIDSGIDISLIDKNLTLFCPDKKGTIVGFIGLRIMIIIATFDLIGGKINSFEGYTLKKGEEYYPEYITKGTYILCSRRNSYSYRINFSIYFYL